MFAGALLLFARHPAAGAAKTRLAPARRADGTAIGREGAARLHRAFLSDSLDACRASGARVLLAHTPGPAFGEARRADEVFPQRGATFGERLDEALRDARGLAPGVPLAVVGSDTPHLSPVALRGALDALADAGAVLGPATKGGFYLLGFRGAPVSIAAAFAEEDECAAVERALAEASLRTAKLPPFRDLDEPSDLEALVLRHARRDPAPDAWVPAETLAALRELGLMPRHEKGARRRANP